MKASLELCLDASGRSSDFENLRIPKGFKENTLFQNLICVVLSRLPKVHPRIGVAAASYVA